MLRAALCILLAAGAVPSCGPDAAAETAPCAREEGPVAGVARIVDGDTLTLDDGRTLRLAGAMAPKLDVPSSDADDTSAGDWPPAREAAQALEALVAGRTLALRYDGPRSDRYGRVLAQVYLVAKDDAGDREHVWVQQQLVREGMARVSAPSGNIECLAFLLAAEREARVAGRGLWRRESYRVLPSDDTRALLRLAGRFVLVAGRVAKVTRKQRTIYINFGADWRSDFTATLAAKPAETTGQDTAARIGGLAGKRVRVRGWIERRNGPLIALGSMDEIEVLDEAGDASQR